MSACVYTSANSLMADHIRNLLAERGIEATVQGRHLSSAAGEIPPAEAWPEVWVLDPERLEEARSIVEEALRGEAPHLRPWVCDRCGETLDGQFSSCWKCDQTAEASEAPTEGDVLYHEVSERASAVSANATWNTWFVLAVLAGLGLWMLRSFARTPW